MITIEELEFTIESKSILIQEQMGKFLESIPMIGNVVGKDPTYVYNKLKDQFNEVSELYNTTTRRNVEILGGYVTTLDKILEVLGEVMYVIENLQTSPPEESIDAKNDSETRLQQAADKVDEIATDIEKRVEDMTGSDIQGDWFKMAMTGTAAYFVLSFLGAGKMISIAGAVGAAYFFGKKDND